MYFNKLEYLLLVTLCVSKCFGSYHIMDDNKNQRFYSFVTKDDKDFYVCTHVDSGPGNCIVYGNGRQVGKTCQGGAEVINGCVDHNGKATSYKFGAILDATDPFRCDWFDKIFKTGHCNPPEVYIKTTKCYNTPVSNSILA